MPDLIRDTPIIAIDVETTGLNPAKERVIEIGAVRRDGSTITTFQGLYNPDRKMTPEVIEVHGIRDMDLFDKPHIGTALKEFVKFCEGGILIAHNAPFDVSFLAAEFQRADVDMPANPVYDTYPLAQSVYPTWANYSLQRLAWGFDLPKRDAHRALDDAKTCLDLFDHCIKGMGGADRAEMNRLTPFECFPSFSHHGKALFDDSANSQRFNITPEMFGVLKANMGGYIEVSMLNKKWEPWRVRLVGVCVDYNRFKKKASLHLITRNSKGVENSYPLEKVARVLPAGAMQTGLFS